MTKPKPVRKLVSEQELRNIIDKVKFASYMDGRREAKAEMGEKKDVDWRMVGVSMMVTFATFFIIFLLRHGQDTILEEISLLNFVMLAALAIGLIVFRRDKISC